MARPETSVRDTNTNRNGGRGAVVGVVLGALGVLAAVWAYWMLVPGVVFGIAAIVLGIRARRGASSETGSAAIALSIAALVLIPSVLAMIDDAEDWGRECALNPTNPDC